MSVTEELALAKTRWAEEEKFYTEIAEETSRTLRRTLRDNRIWAVVSHRVKELRSLLRKIVRKRTTYDSLTDKAGVRVVTHFVADTPATRDAIRANFDVRKEDDKREELIPWTLGYSGIHYDIMVTKGEHAFPCEIQVKSLGEHTWAEISHVLAYKDNEKVPRDLRRRLNTLSALLEVADVQFDDVRMKLTTLPETEPLRILSLLEDHFVKIATADYDRELSLDFLSAVMPLVTKTFGNDVETALAVFVEGNRETLTQIFDEQVQLALTWSPIILQPESILIFALLDTAPMSTERHWPGTSPPELLDQLKVLWGIPGEATL